LKAAKTDQRQEKNPAYPYSKCIVKTEFDWSSHIRLAPGSDNWPITWAADGNQYTAWGDGGGFGGTNRDGRVSLGIARIKGNVYRYSGHNIWGGKNSENDALFFGKSYGIIAIDNTLYMWVSPGSNVAGFNESRLYKSENRGASWTRGSWAFKKKDGLLHPTFLQFGKGYNDARDLYVYIYAIQIKDSSKLKVQKPGEISLLRTEKKRLMDKDSYEYFAGFGDTGIPLWTSDLSRRKPVFRDNNGVGWNCAVSFNHRLNRYILTTEHTESFKGNLGIFEASHPWGPWNTVVYEESFGAGRIEPTTFFWNFSNKWLSEDGREFILIFTGINENDSWNTVKGKFIVAPKKQSFKP
jgi:hypothetical protein